MNRDLLRFAFALAIVVSLVALPGCRKRAKRSARAPRAVVTVQSVGVAPRVRLRYQFRAGESLTYRMTSQRRISGVPSATAPVTTTLSMYIDRVVNKRARLRWRVEGVSSGSSRLRGTQLWVETSDRGEITSVSQGRPTAKKGPEQLDQSMRQLFLSWPAQALGPGARWTQRRDLILAASSRGGFKTRVVARYRFERIARCGQGRCAHFSVRTTVALSHKAGKVKVMGKGAGSGQVVFDLDRGRLQKSHTRAQIDLSTSLAPDKVVQKITLIQSMELTR